MTAGRHRVPFDSTDGRTHRRQIAAALNGAMSGHIDCTTSITLAINVTSTTLSDPRISAQTVALLQPQTPAAGAEVAAGTLYWTCSQGQLTVFHSNLINPDRTFGVVLLG